VKRSGLLSRLIPGRAARLRARVEQDRARDLLRQLRYEVERVRSLAATHARDAAAASARARRAEEQVLALGVEVARLREELLWAWAEGRLPAAPIAPPAAEVRAGLARVIDLRDAAAT
jgi:hypothetical protein